MAASKVSLKLLVDKNGKKVLFAEAGKDFIDFLFNIMSMPVGTVTRLLTKNSMVGSLGNLYDSIETLSETYLQTNQTRGSLLRPKAPPSALNIPALLPKECNNNNTSAPVYVKRLYQCQKAFTTNRREHGLCVYEVDDYGQTNTKKCRSNVSDDCQAVCPNCNMLMSTELTYINPPPKEHVKPITHGFVKEVVTYMVMDDLVVSPMSTISSITLLNKFGIKGIDTLEERVVDLGIDEGLKLLKESLQSKEVLTSVFLKN